MYGRGRGRGRGRGGRYIPPPKEEGREDIAKELQGPPRLFPDVILPPIKEPTEEERHLVSLMRSTGVVQRVWRELGSFYKSSAYHLDLPSAKKAKKGYVLDDPYSSALDRKNAAERSPLTSVLTLDPCYLPAELFSDADQRASARAASSQTFAPFASGSPADTGTDIFDRFAKLERVEVGSVGQAAGGGEGGASRAMAGDNAEGRKGQPLQQQDAEQEDEDEEQVEEEEQGWDDGDDDYGQGQYFDDDEGYDEDDGDDGGGATY